MRIEIVFSIDPPTLHLLGNLTDHNSAKLDLIITQGQKIMAAVDDLNAAVVALQTATTATLADIAALTQQILDANAGNDPAIETAAGQINAAAAALQAAVTPPPGTTPATPVAAVLAASTAATPALRAAAANASNAGATGTPPRAPAFTPRT